MSLSIDEIQMALHKARLRCAILEADLEAKKAARMAQEKRALRYRCIIDQLMNGDDNVVMDDDDTHDDVRSQETSKGKDPYHPQPPTVDLKASLHSTLPCYTSHSNTFGLKTFGAELMLPHHSLAKGRDTSSPETSECTHELEGAHSSSSPDASSSQQSKYRWVKDANLSKSEGHEEVLGFTEEEGPAS